MGRPVQAGQPHPDPLPKALVHATLVAYTVCRHGRQASAAKTIAPVAVATTMGWSASRLRQGTDAMSLQAAAVLVDLAVKNGPAGMWRALGSPSSGAPVNRFVTSPLWLAGAICVCLTLAPSVYRATRGAGVRARAALFLTSAALGLVVMVDLLAHGTALPLLVFSALVVAAVSVALRAGSRTTHHHAAHTAEVVDLARRRTGRSAGGRIEPR